MRGVAVLLLIAFGTPGVSGQTASAPVDPVAALQEARAAAVRAPAEFAPALAVARALTAVGRAEEALAAFARARALWPDSGALPPESGGGGSAAVELASAYLAPALLLRDLDRTAEAIRLLEEAANRRIGSADVHEQLALLRLAEGNADDALAAIDAAAAQGLRSPGLALARGLALTRDPDRRGEALKLLRQALADGAGEPVTIHLEAAESLSAAARYPEALDHLRTAGDLAPDEPEVAYRLGRTLAAAGDRAGAEAALERYRVLASAREQAAETERARAAERAAGLSEAQELAAAGNLDAALNRLEALLRGGADDPRMAAVWSLRAKLLFSMERAGAAAESVAEALRLQPQQVEHHYLEGLFLHADGRAEEAAAALERALALDPELGEAHALLGMIAAEAGRPQEAAERMERALSLGLGGNAALRFNYARVLEALGRSEQAAAQMRAFERLRSERQGGG